MSYSNKIMQVNKNQKICFLNSLDFEVNHIKGRT